MKLGVHRDSRVTEPDLSGISSFCQFWQKTAKNSAKTLLIITHNCMIRFSLLFCMEVGVKCKKLTEVYFFLYSLVWPIFTTNVLCVHSPTWQGIWDPYFWSWQAIKNTKKALNGPKMDFFNNFDSFLLETA